MGTTPDLGRLPPPRPAPGSRPTSSRSTPTRRVQRVRDGAAPHPGGPRRRARPAEAALRRRLRRDHLAEGVRRPGPRAGVRAGVQRGGRRLPHARPRPRRRHHLRRVRAGDAAPRRPRLPHPPRAADAVGRRAVRAALLRAGRGVRHGRRDDQGGARRRPLAPDRLEDLDQRRRHRRLRHVPGPHQLGRAEAPRAHVVRHAPRPAGRHDRADPGDQRRGRRSARSSSTRSRCPPPR